MPLISHRGAAGLVAPNTIESINEAIKYSPEYIEIDINCSSDGTLVVHHGSAVRFFREKRTKESYVELKATNPALLTLEELFSQSTHVPFMFDIKVAEDELLDTIIQTITTHIDHHLAFTSPHEKALVRMKRAFPRAQIFQSQPYHHGPVAAVEIARKHKFEGVALNKWWMTPLVYRLCKIHGKKLMCYTVDSQLGIRLIVRFFPDVYVVTNRPDIYRRISPSSST